MEEKLIGWLCARCHASVAPTEKTCPECGPDRGVTVTFAPCQHTFVYGCTVPYCSKCGAMAPFTPELFST